MSLFYRLAYRLGITPWESAAARGSALIAKLFDREQQGREAPFGRALDLGCGRGLQSIDLAARGWLATGLDNVPKALDAARERARQAGLDVQFIQGDVTALRASGVGDGYRFFLDIGCFHGLNDKERAAMGREVDAAAAPGASLLLLAWAPGNRAPLPRGASQADIEAAFPGWKVLDVDDTPPGALPKPLRGVNPRFYRLKKAA
jgi:SAM-dependent methyltransferase